MTESPQRRARITGIGSYLPPEVRTNDWWPADVVKSWTRDASLSKPPSTDGLSPAALQIIAHMSVQGDDPFLGSVARHVMPAGMSIVEMEVAAANDALARARVEHADIDLLLTHTVTPDWQLANPAAMLHHALGLRAECFTMHAESSAYSFLHQLALADAMFATGRARKALLVQSCAATRLVDPHSSVAPYFGDGATAVVVEASDGGVVTSVHFTDGRYPDTIVASVPGGTWYDAGRPVLHVKNALQMRSVLLQTVDLCKASIELALQRSGHSAGEVAFFCIHQGTPWLRRLAQEASGLARARSVETFAKTGYLFSAIIPFGLRAAHDEGLLREGDLVALFGGGTGMTYGATLLEWSNA